MDIFQKLYEIENETGGDVSGIKKLIDSGQVTIASSMPSPDPKDSVREINLINSFVQRNPRDLKADGGTIGGGNIQGQQIGNRTGFAGPQLIKTGEDKGKYKVRYRDEKFGKRKGAKGYKEGNEISWMTRKTI